MFFPVLCMGSLMSGPGLEPTRRPKRRRASGAATLDSQPVDPPSPPRPVRLTFANPVQVPEAAQEPVQLSDEDIELESVFENKVTRFELCDFLAFAILPRPESTHQFFKGIWVFIPCSLTCHGMFMCFNAFATHLAGCRLLSNHGVCGWSWSTLLFGTFWSTT